MTCSHLNATITIRDRMVTKLTITNGVLELSKDLENKNLYSFECYDCGIERNYGGRPPKWILKIINNYSWAESYPHNHYARGIICN